MPPKTAAEKIAHRTNNLIGLFAVSVVFFVITFAVGRSTPHPATPMVLWFFGLMGGASLVGWMAMAFLNAPRLGKLPD